MKWYSEAGQDKFAYDVCGPKGTFLDVGCAWPILDSNSFALEQMGWRGLLIDCDPQFEEKCHKHRSSPIIVSDAVQVDWERILPSLHIGPIIDYISLDLDHHSELIVLQQLLDSEFFFRALTIEHDKYSQGTEQRDKQRKLLFTHGYDLVFGDVKHSSGVEFEDWWRRP